MEFCRRYCEVSAATFGKLLSLWSWSLLYLSVARDGRPPEWCSRAVTLLHGLVAALVGLSQCGLGNVMRLHLCKLTAKTLRRHYCLMIWSWGYFAFDLAWCLVSGTESLLILGHHVTALAGIEIYMRKQHGGRSFACILSIMEISNPPLQIRWFLRDEGYEKTLIYTVVEVTYILLFLGMRGIGGTVMLYLTLKDNQFDLDQKIISVVLYVVSMLLVYEIIGYVCYKYKSKPVQPQNRYYITSC